MAPLGKALLQGDQSCYASEVWRSYATDRRESTLVAPDIPIKPDAEWASRC